MGAFYIRRGLNETMDLTALLRTSEWLVSVACTFKFVVHGLSDTSPRRGVCVTLSCPEEMKAFQNALWKLLSSCPC